MKHKIGDKIRIIADSNDHGLSIDSITKIIDFDFELDPTEYFAEEGWYIKEQDCELYEEKEELTSNPTVKKPSVTRTIEVRSDGENNFIFESKGFNNFEIYCTDKDYGKTQDLLIAELKLAKFQLSIKDKEIEEFTNDSNEIMEYSRRATIDLMAEREKNINLGKEIEELKKEVERMTSNPIKESCKNIDVESFVDTWVKGHESNTFIKNQYGNIVYSAGASSINLIAFFENLLNDYIEENK